MAQIQAILQKEKDQKGSKDAFRVEGFFLNRGPQQKSLKTPGVRFTLKEWTTCYTSNRTGRV
jgi:hypothetical protein